ncbi:MAG: Brp/Blh family beta-carotene 15,15'-dioxygenase [Sphingomicrobium sp.]
MSAFADKAPPIIRRWTMAAAFVALLMLSMRGVDLASPLSTVVACAAILAFGLPHGTLDLAIIQRERKAGRVAMGILLFCYLGLAALMAATWHFAPVVALAVFLVIAALHFAEDWREHCPPFLAQAMAVALLSVPALLHLTALEHLFVALTGSGSASIVANVLLLVAPMSLAVATVAIGAMRKASHDRQAIAGAITLAAMILLPPVVGFALFFSLHHSPSQFKAAIARTSGGRRAWQTIAMLTLVAVGICAALFVGEVRADLPDQFVAASFMTLSLLTLPHMVIPAVFKPLAMREPASKLPFEPPQRRAC